MVKSIKRVLVAYVFCIMPETRFFAFKRVLFRWLGYKIGCNTKICSSVRIIGGGQLIIGNDVWIGPETMIVTSSKVIIEDNVDIAPRVYIGTGTHVIGDKKGRIAGTGAHKEVQIKKGSWLCVGCVILPGVIVSEMSIVSAGAVVTKKFPSFSILGGVPAKQIKSLRNESN